MRNAMTGKVAIVTGGGQGIGKCIAGMLLKEGMKVAIADIDGEACDESASEFSDPGTALVVETDVGDEMAVERLVSETVSRFGRIDALINNAGIAKSNWGTVEKLALADWNKVIATNLTGVYLCCKHAIPHLRATKGAIVNIASTRALQSEPDTEPYSASKGGVLSLSHSLAMSLGPEIRVNCISPGWIDTREWKKASSREKPGLGPEDHSQHPVGRVGIPEDVAGMVVYLISPDAAFVTGQNFIIDGGMTRKMIYLE